MFITLIKCIGIFYFSICLIAFSFNLWLRNSVTFTKKEAANLREKKFLIIGAGFSGLAVGYFFKKFKLDFLIVDRAEEIGGTWFLNRYPGAAVDVPSFLYQYSFFTKKDWPESYNCSSELFRYLKSFVKWAGLEENIRLNISVENCRWNGERKLWEVEFSKEGKSSVEYFDWTIVCTGSFNEPNKPKFKDQGDFSGRIVHTGEWPKDLNITGKRVAVIGSGSSASQTVPGLLDAGALEVTQFQRTAGFVLPRWLEFKIPSSLHFLMKIYPFDFLLRGFFWSFQEILFLAFDFHGSFWNRGVANLAHWHRTSTIKDPVLREKLKPAEGMRFGCKRAILSTAIYEAANDPRYSLVSSKIAKFNSSGIVTEENEEISADIIVLATGFKVHYYPFLKWLDSKSPRCFYGTFDTEKPNLVYLLGPMTLLGNSSVIIMIEAQIELLLRVLKKAAVRKARICLPKEASVQTWLKSWESRIDESVWTKKYCNSWYQTGKEGRPESVWPGTTMEYIIAGKTVSVDNFLYE